MARLFGLIGNRADIAGSVLAAELASDRVSFSRVKLPPGGADALGWGVGFFQGGELLLRRRPIDDHPDVEVAGLVRDIRGDVIISQVRAATVGAHATENTQPFRHRQWLLAATGSLDQFATLRPRLLASIPDFLRNSIAGETEGELLLYLFLSCLRDSGHLDDSRVDPRSARAALTSCVATVDAFAAEVGAAPLAMNILLSDGESLLALHRGEAMFIRTVAGKSEIEPLIANVSRRQVTAHELAHARFAIVASDFDTEPSAAWRAVPRGSVVSLTRDGEVSTIPLSPP